jgi:hypothetical protein
VQRAKYWRTKAELLRSYGTQGRQPLTGEGNAAPSIVQVQSEAIAGLSKRRPKHATGYREIDEYPKRKQMLRIFEI